MTFTTPGRAPRHGSGALSLHDCNASCVPHHFHRKILIFGGGISARCELLRRGLSKFTQSDRFVCQKRMVKSMRSNSGLFRVSMVSIPRVGYGPAVQRAKE